MRNSREFGPSGHFCTSPIESTGYRALYLFKLRYSMEFMKQQNTVYLSGSSVLLNSQNISCF